MIKEIYLQLLLPLTLLNLLLNIDVVFGIYYFKREYSVKFKLTTYFTFLFILWVAVPAIALLERYFGL